MAGKPPSASGVQMTEMVLPSDANPLGTVFGGKVMQWIDVAASIAAGRHSRTPVVTVSMDALHFHAPIRVGEVALLTATVHAAFKSSMECGVTVHSENLVSGQRRLCTSAFLTFVAIDERGTPVAVPPLEPETDEERQAFAEALARRQRRLSGLAAKH